MLEAVKSASHQSQTLPSTHRCSILANSQYKPKHEIRPFALSRNHVAEFIVMDVEIMIGLLQDILFKLLSIVLESSPYILLGFFIAGILHVFFPTSLFSRIFGREGIRPLLNAVGLGALIPVCSCGVIPIGLGAYRGGAGIGTALAFMTAAPTLSPASVLLSAKLLGLGITFWQAFFVIMGSFLIGLLGNRLFQSYRPQPPSNLVPLELTPAIPSCCQDKPVVSLSANKLPANKQTEDCCSHDLASDAPVSLEQTTPLGSHASAKPRWQGIQKLYRWMFVEFGPSVSLDMLAGLLVAATILTIVPAETIVMLTGSKTLWSLLLVTLVSLPIYTCSMAAIPVAYSFFLAGMSPGAVATFLIAGPAANFGGINAIRGQIGWKVATYYSLSLLVIALTAGYFIDHVALPNLTSAALQTSPSAGHDHHHHHHPEEVHLLEWFCTFTLGLLVVIESTRRIRQRWNKRKAGTVSTTVPAHSTSKSL